jgi:hypothetical protein
MTAMRERGKRIGTALMIIVTFAALVAIGLVGLSLVGQQSQPNGANPEDVIASSSSLGLKLSVLVQPRYDNGVSIGVTLSNTRPSTNNLTNPGFPPLPLGPCGSSNYWPFGYEVLQGNYGANNFTQGKYAQIWQFIPYCSDNIPPQSYSFAPNSENFAVSYPVEPPGLVSAKSGPDTYNGEANLYEDFFGTWSGSNLTPFPHGAYTVVAEDSWGQRVIAHFNL